MLKKNKKKRDTFASKRVLILDKDDRKKGKNYIRRETSRED
jgi:hypothetical protein